MQFKVSDKVRCLTPGLTTELKEGVVYTIEQVYGSVIVLEGFDIYWYSGCFELAESAESI